MDTGAVEALSRIHFPYLMSISPHATQDVSRLKAEEPDYP